MSRAKSILIVDDEEQIQVVLREILKTEGYRLAFACTGSDSLQRFEAGEAFDLVLLDHGLPGIKGVDLAPRIKEVSPKTAIVLITGNPDLVEGAVPAFIDAVIAKPFDFSLLLERIRSLS